MKILHVIPSLSSKRGGPSFAVRYMAQAIAAIGNIVDVIATDDDGPEHLSVPLEQPIVEYGVTYRYFRRQTRFYTASWPLTRWLAKHIHEYDLVHIHALFSYSTIPAAYYANRDNVPYIIRPLGTLNRWGIQNRRAHLKQISLRLIERPLLRRAAALHFTCEQERQEACEVGIHGPSVILPLGLDLSLYQSLPTKGNFLSRYPHLKDKTLILFLSRLDPKKGFDLLLPAFAQVHHEHPDIALIVAGSGETAYVMQLQAQAQALGIEQAIIWVGFVAGEEKLSMLAAADLFVLPSYSENFGIAVVEAMAAGLPVIISDQVGIHHEVSRGNAGLVIACQVAELKDALMLLGTNSQQRRILGDNGRHLVAELFSQAAMTRHLLAMYEQVLTQKVRFRRRIPN